MKNLKKLVELCDCEWIQEKQYRRHRSLSDIFIIEQPTTIFFIGSDEKYIYDDPGCKSVWVPAGFNPETGNWQIDDLLMETEKVGECISGESHKAISLMGELFIDWKWDYWGRETHEPGEKNLNDLILKLIWLRELIKEREDDNC